MGDTVAIPTETVYGLAANAWDASAVLKIFQAKERPLFDPLIVHIPKSWKALSTLNAQGIVDAARMSPIAKQTFELLQSTFWPGPLTMVLPKHEKISDLVSSGLPTVGVRLPAHPLTLSILEAVALPLAAPSANRFGRISPTSARDVFSELGNVISYIVDGGASEVGIESTVAQIGESSVTVLRPGRISLADLQACLSPLSIKVMTDKGLIEAKADSPLASPGQLASHYAPRKPLYLIRRDGQLPPAAKDFALLALSIESLKRLRAQIGDSRGWERCLSSAGDPQDIARNLFSSLRQLDDSDALTIVAEWPESNDGLWFAIRDRLRRAATNSNDFREM